MTRESGDRTGFLGTLRHHLADGVPANPAHPLPPPLGEIPVLVSSRLDPDDLVGSFVRNARDVKMTVHDLDAAEVPDELLTDVVARHEVRRAVVAADPDAQALAGRLGALGVEVRPVSIEASAEADLGVTGVVAGLATTGSLVQDSRVMGGRTASLLPRIHLCVVPARRIVASSADVLRGLGSASPLPSNLVLITGPSKSGDIEQIITVGVHGPIAVEIVVLRQA